MKSSVSSWLRAGAMHTLAGLAIVAVFGLAVPSAFADISLSYTATDVGTSTTVDNNATPATNTLLVGNPGPPPTTVAVGNFGITISTTTNDPAGGTTSIPGVSNMATTSITVQNLGTSPSPDTLNLYVTGQGFTVGPNNVANYTVQGTTGLSASASDTTTGSSYISTSNTAYGGSPLSAGTGTAIPPSGGLTGTPSSYGASKSYVFPNVGNSGNLGFTNGGVFSMTQLLSITLGAGDSASFTISTSAVPTPEPSTMALAGLGALGLIGYGVRRRKAAAV